MSDSARCMWMRGGTSKGGFFVADDLPADTAARDAFLLAAMGSPDPRQIDGMGGADPLTSKVAVVKRSDRPGIDLDYLFLQVGVDTPSVSDAQNCGNLLAAVGPFAVERGLMQPTPGTTTARIYMENTDQTATARFETPNGVVRYDGPARIDGVPNSAAPIHISFADTAGASCGALLPTGSTSDEVVGVTATLIDNGMPCVIIAASDMGLTGNETRSELDANENLKARLETIRLAAGPAMNLGDVKDKTIPKMVMVSPPKRGGALSTRTFIPHRCHASIGVFGAVSVATAAIMPGSIAHAMADLPAGQQKELRIEHPIGQMTIIAETGKDGTVTNMSLLRTARKLFDGTIFAGPRNETRG